MEDEAPATQHRVGSSLNQQNGSGDSGPPTPPPRRAAQTDTPPSVSCLNHTPLQIWKPADGSDLEEAVTLSLLFLSRYNLITEQMRSVGI